MECSISTAKPSLSELVAACSQTSQVLRQARSLRGKLERALQGAPRVAYERVAARRYTVAQTPYHKNRAFT